MNNKGYMLPVSILIAAVLISGAVIFSAGQSGTDNPNNDLTTDDIEPVTENDHIKGDMDAPIKIVEYSDTECPFCKDFHGSLQEAVDNYPDQVAWIYRHFPIESLHPKAPKEAEALECAEDLGGNDAFWAYTDRIYEITPSNNNLDLNELPAIAEYTGLNVDDFNECLESGKFADKVESQYQDAVQSGGQGTPYSLVIKDGEVLGALPGYVPYDQLSQIIDQVLAEE